MANQDNGHPRHPVRNFFYMLWMILLSCSFAGFWYGAKHVATTEGKIIVSACGVLIAIGLLLGLFLPIKKNRNYRR